MLTNSYTKALTDVDASACLEYHNFFDNTGVAGWSASDGAGLCYEVESALPPNAREIVFTQVIAANGYATACGAANIDCLCGATPHHTPGHHADAAHTQPFAPSFDLRRHPATASAPAATVDAALADVAGGGAKRLLGSVHARRSRLVGSSGSL